MNSVWLNKNSKIVRVYKNQSDRIYKVKQVFKYLSCCLKFNELDNTWDCVVMVLDMILKVS